VDIDASMSSECFHKGQHPRASALLLMLGLVEVTAALEAHGDLCADLLHLPQLQVGDHHLLARVGGGQHGAPGRDNRAVAPRLVGALGVARR
jgi:hypothetical protein